MEPYSYTPFILLGLFMFLSLFALFTWSERERKKEDRKMSSFLRQMHIENLQERKETRKLHHDNQKTNQRIEKTIEELQQLNKSNQIILHRIFERVDNLPEETSS